MTTEERIREAVEAHLARVQQDLEAHGTQLTSVLSQVVADQRAEWQTELDRAVADGRSAEARDAEGRLQAALLASQEATAAEAAMSSGGRSPREIHVETLERLLGEVRRIDEANSLTEILDALLRGAAAETSRVAILLVDGYMFRTWRHLGFQEGTGPTEMPIGGSGTFAAAVALKKTSFVPPVIEGRESTAPTFMRVPAGHTGLVVPLTVGGDVVAVLYADDVDRTPAQEDAPLWTEELELLARHAAIRLENVTSVRTVEVLAGTD